MQKENQDYASIQKDEYVEDYIIVDDAPCGHLFKARSAVDFICRCRQMMPRKINYPYIYTGMFFDPP